MRRMWGWMTVAGLVLAGCGPTTTPSGPSPSADSTVTETPASEPVAAESGTPAPYSSEALPATGEPTLAPATGIAPAGDAPADRSDAPANSNAPTGTDAAPTPAAGDAPKPAAGDAPKPETGAAANAGTAVPLAEGVATLGPDNTKIQFVGTHAGDKPDPRTGSFAKFSGQAKVDPASKSLASVSVDIDTTSVFTPIQKLTDHLKTADFFEVREFPTAKFESTKIVPGEGGQAQITGNLTLHGETKEINFPATVQVTDEGLAVRSEFSIDRSQFGMTFSPDKVDNKVTLTVVIGEKN